jgi:small subunit ribosomal protein S12e
VHREETPVVEVAAPAPGEPMDINTAVRLVMKKALAHDGLARGLHEAARCIERVRMHTQQLGAVYIYSS